MQLNVNASTLEDNLRFALRDGLSIFLDEAKAAPLFHHKKTGLGEYHPPVLMNHVLKLQIARYSFMHQKLDQYAKRNQPPTVVCLIKGPYDYSAHLPR